MFIFIVIIRDVGKAELDSFAVLEKDIGPR